VVSQSRWAEFRPSSIRSGSLLRPGRGRRCEMVSQSRRAELRRGSILSGPMLHLRQRRGEGLCGAVKWYRKAPSRITPRLNTAGLCYANGQGVTKDEVEAVKWYREAAEQNNAVLNPVWAPATTMPKACRGCGGAVKWYRKPPSRITPRSILVGWCYYSGKRGKG